MLKLGKHILILLSLLSASIGLLAQQGNNPFELPGRKIPTEEVNPETNLPVAVPTDQNPFEIEKDTATELPATETPPNQDNPFEMDASPVTTSDGAPGSSGENASAESAIDPQNPFEVKRPSFSRPKASVATPNKKSVITGTEPLSGKFKLWMTILLVTVLTVLVNIYKSALAKVYRSFLNDNFLKMVHRDYGTVSMIPYLILYVFALILIGTFVFVVLTHYKIAFFAAPILNFLACTGGVFAIFIIKHLILQIIGSVFPVSKEIEQYSFTIIIFGTMIGFFLLPTILLIIYAPANLTLPLIYGTFIVIGLIYLYRILRSLFIGLKYISLHKFHFFVYLCTIEIAPLLVLVKLVTNQ